jgi:hypothetical protein
MNAVTPFRTGGVTSWRLKSSYLFWLMAQLLKERTRLRAVDPHYCKHPKLIPIWKYKHFPGKTFCKCLVCGREMVFEQSLFRPRP